MWLILVTTVYWNSIADGDLIKDWGTVTGNGAGQFKNPQGVAVDSSGNVYVADTDNDRIQKFSSDGTYYKMGYTW